MFVLNVFRDEKNIRMQFGECMPPDSIWKILNYSFDRNEFVSFTRVDEPITRTSDEEADALDYVDEAMGE